MSGPVDEALQNDAGQLLLFDAVRRSTFNPPSEPKRSAADWLLSSTKSTESTDSTTTNSSSVKEGTA